MDEKTNGGYLTVQVDIGYHYGRVFFFPKIEIPVKI